MAITLVQTKYANLGATGDSIAFDSPPTVGNLIVAYLWSSGGAATMTGPVGWTDEGTYGLGDYNDYVGMFWKIVDGTEGASYSFGLGTSSRLCRLAEYSGGPFTRIDAASLTDGAKDITATVGPVTATYPALLVGMTAADNNEGSANVQGMGLSAGWTSIGGASAGGNWAEPGYQVVPSAGDYSLTGAFRDTSDFSYYPAPGVDPSGWAGVLLAFSGTPDPIVPKITITINSVEFTSLLSKEVRVELNGPGECHFTIDRGDPQATEANLARGSIIQVTIPEIHSGVLAEFLLEEGDFDLLSSDEEGGQELRFGGPGILSVLKRSVISYEEYLDSTGIWKPNKGRVVFDADVTEGHIVNKLVREAQAAGRPSDPIPMVTRTFDATNDSNGDPWGDQTLEGNWKIPMGSNLYDEILRLVRAGLLSVEMAPGFDLNLYRDTGTDRTSATFAAGKVRFVGGVNIAGELARGMAGRDFATHAYIRYGDGAWTNAAKIYGSFPYEQEIYHEAGSTGSAVTARRSARGEMGWRETTQEALLLSHTVPWPGDGPDDDAGLYLPGPAWSDNGRYWPGDLISVDTGSGEFDYDNATHRVYAITLLEDATGYLAPPIVELNAPYLSADQVSSGLSASPIAGTVTGGGSGTIKVDLTAYQQTSEKDQADGYAGLDSSGLVPIAELGAHTGDASDAHDASAISFDPAGLSYVTGTDVQQAIEELDAAIPAAGVLHNFAATTDPTTGDDSGDGYAVGSRWVNTTSDEEFVCLDASVGAAVWASTTATGSGMTNPMTTQDDIIVGGAAGAPARLGKGTDGQVLTVDPTTHHLAWATPAASSGDVATDTIWDAAGDLAVGSGANTAARLAAGSENDVLTIVSGVPAWAAGGGGSASDPVADVFGTPDTAHEFDTSSLTGLTALTPTPDTESADAMIAGQLFYADNTIGDYWCGRYLAKTAASPFTVIIKIPDHSVRANYNAAGVFVGEATPGKLTVYGLFAAGLRAIKYNSPTSYSADLTSAEPAAGVKFLGIVVNSTTDIDLWASREGFAWWKHADAKNPALTIGSVGLAMASNNASGLQVGFDYIRVWDSVLTFPGF